MTIESLIVQARNSDLVVMGRAQQKQGLPKDTLERLILRCGRPMLLAGAVAPEQFGTIMVCWKKSDHSARAVAAAMPLLSQTKRVVFTTVAKPDAEGIEALNKLAQPFQRDNVQTDVKVISPNGRKIPDVLSAAAEECAADLVVMGAYGRARALEFLFGSCTESAHGPLRQGDLAPALRAHCVATRWQDVALWSMLPKKSVFRLGRALGTN